MQNVPPLLTSGGYAITSTELKHQARLQEWAGAIQDCRSSGLSVRQWCRERGTTPTTYYRWERELLSVASTTKALPETPAAAFAELPVPKQMCCNAAERSATCALRQRELVYACPGGRLSAPRLGLLRPLGRKGEGKMGVSPLIRSLYVLFCSQFRLLTCLLAALISGSLGLSPTGEKRGAWFDTTRPFFDR